MTKPRWHQGRRCPMFSESKRAAILELHKLGHSIRGIAQGLGAARVTVRRIVSSGTTQVPMIVRHNKAEADRTQIIVLYSRYLSNAPPLSIELLAPGGH